MKFKGERLVGEMILVKVEVVAMEVMLVMKMVLMEEVHREANIINHTSSDPSSESFIPS